MLEIKRYHPGDLLELTLPGEHYERLAAGMDPADLAGVAFSIYAHGELVACAGLLEQKPHLASAWICQDGRVGVRAWVELRRFIREMAGVWLERYKRIEANCDPLRPAHKQFLKSLGFQYEGLMRAAGSGGRSDLELWARIG